MAHKNKFSRAFLTGAEVIVKAAQDVGAEYFFGYPITPASEIAVDWSQATKKNKQLGFLQTEDEIAAGFAINGSVLAGRPAFSATAGPGTVLIQDGLSMAEAMRLPVVVVVAQRGGPSSGTVIYSQQEVNLAIYGGNTEGMRLVYSSSTLEELYQNTQKAFINAWKYRFPAIVLTDGYQSKTRGVLEVPSTSKKLKSQPLVVLGANQHLPNIFTFEEELFVKLQKDVKDFNKMAEAVIGYEEFNTRGAEILIIAHGTVGGVAKEAVQKLLKKKVGLFRPITLNPFPKTALNKLAKKVKKIIVIESSLGQLERLVRANLDENTKVDHYLRPGLGIEVDEIIKLITK